MQYSQQHINLQDVRANCVCVSVHRTLWVEGQSTIGENNGNSKNNREMSFSYFLCIFYWYDPPFAALWSLLGCLGKVMSVQRLSWWPLSTLFGTDPKTIYGLPAPSSTWGRGKSFGLHLTCLTFPVPTFPSSPYWRRSWPASPFPWTSF